MVRAALLAKVRLEARQAVSSRSDSELGRKSSSRTRQAERLRRIKRLAIPCSRPGGTANRNLDRCRMEIVAGIVDLVRQRFGPPDSAIMKPRAHHLFRRVDIAQVHNYRTCNDRGH